MTHTLQTAIAHRKRGAEPVPLVSPCCRKPVELRGEPAPRYHCECGAEWDALKPLVKEDET